MPRRLANPLLYLLILSNGLYCVRSAFRSGAAEQLCVTYPSIYEHTIDGVAVQRWTCAFQLSSLKLICRLGNPDTDGIREITTFAGFADFAKDRLFGRVTSISKETFQWSRLTARQERRFVQSRLARASIEYPSSPEMNILAEYFEWNKDGRPTKQKRLQNSACPGMTVLMSYDDMAHSMSVIQTGSIPGSGCGSLKARTNFDARGWPAHETVEHDNGTTSERTWNYVEVKEVCSQRP